MGGFMKLLFSIISILVVVIAGLLVAPSFIDWSKYSGQIKAQVEKSTGYKLELNGKISATILPTTQVTINNVGIDSAGAKGPVGFVGTAEKASVSVSLFPLLSGNIVVNDVTLIKPILTVKQQKSDTPEQQQLNDLTNADASTSGNSSVNNVQLDAVYIEEAQITYQPLEGKAMAVIIPKLSLNAQSLQGPFEFDGRIIYDTFDLNLDGKVGKMIDKEPFSIVANIDGGAYALNYNGVVDATKDDPEVQGELSVNAKSIQSLANQFGAKDIKIKDQSFTLNGLIAGNAKNIRLDNGQLSLGSVKNKMPVKFNYAVEQQKGAVKVQSLPGGGSIDMDIAMANSGTKLAGQLTLPNIKALASDTLGLVDAKTFDNPQIPNSVSGDINASLGDVMTLISKELTAGQYKLSNTNAKYIAGDNPKIDLSIGSFDGAAIKASGTLDGANGVNVSVSHPNAVKFIRIFQKDFKSSPNLEKPFAFSGLVLKDGDIISAKNISAKIGDISTTGELSMDSGASVPSIKAVMNFGNLDTQALISGEKSSAVKGNPTANQTTTSKSTAAPWTRDAIDTSALRSINLDLTAKADQLVHGTWLISNPTIDVDLKNGVLDINTIKGGLFNGAIDMSGRVEAKAEGQPLSISTKINATDVDLSKLVKAAMSQTKDRVVGNGSFNLSLSTSGLSSSALVYALNGDGKITSSDLTIKGIDLAKITEAISDESLTDLAAVVQGAFRSGQTTFQPINHPLTIREGTMAVDNFTLVSSTANIIADGEISFSRWNMNIKNTIDFTNPDDLPSVDMTIKGPLNAPQQNVANDVLTSFIKNKYGAKIQKELGKQVDKLLGDKLKDLPAGSMINNLLGLPQKQPATTSVTPAPEAATTTPASETSAPAPEPEPSNDNAAPIEVTPTETTPVETAPVEAEPVAEQSPEEQIIKGLFDQFAQ